MNFKELVESDFPLSVLFLPKLFYGEDAHPAIFHFVSQIAPVDRRPKGNLKTGSF